MDGNFHDLNIRFASVVIEKSRLTIMLPVVDEGDSTEAYYFTDLKIITAFEQFIEDSG